MAQLEENQNIIGIKSKSNKYLNVSKGFTEFCEFEQPKQIVGINEFQLIDHSYHSSYYDTHTLAEEFILEDEMTLRGEHLFIFDTLIINEKTKFSLTHKSPYIEHNTLVGTFFHTVLLPQPTKQTVKSYLSNPDIIVASHTKKYLDVFQLAPSRKYNLTQRELQCLELIIQGDTAKNAAAKLNLSKRTVESYVRNIKDKFNVNKISEVIAVALLENSV